jgi:hypothetical protein
MMTVRNPDLMLRTLARVTANPEEHDQYDWISLCGTKMCFAGHAVVEGLGDDVVIDQGNFGVYQKGQYLGDVEELAVGLLGLARGTGEIGALFYNATNLEEVTETVYAIIERWEEEAG